MSGASELDAFGGSTTAYTREQLAKLAFVTFYSPILCAPQNIAAVTKEIDCCPGCDHVTNGGTCRVSERGDYCPNDVAETLRQISIALYGPGEPSHYVASVFGPDKVAALSASRAEVVALREAAWAAHEVMHKCTAVLTANDCAEVAAAMAALRTALAGEKPVGAGVEMHEPGTIRVCPQRDSVCPHGLSCPYVEGYECSDPALSKSGEKP